MADRASASITLGGTITAVDYAELLKIAADEGLSVEWDGPVFTHEERIDGEPLFLCAHEVSWGYFDTLEAWCVKKKFSFSRWSGACAGSFGPERVVFTGKGEPKSYDVNEEDDIVISRDTVNRLGSFEAILDYFDEAEVTIPPLVVEDDPAPETRD